MLEDVCNKLLISKKKKEKKKNKPRFKLQK